MKVVLAVLALSFTGTFASQALAPVAISSTANKSANASQMALKARILLNDAELAGDLGRQSATRSSSRRGLIGEGGKTGLIGEGGRTSLIGTNGRSALIGENGKLLIGENGKNLLIGEGGKTGLIGEGGRSGLIGEGGRTTRNP